MGYPLLRNCAWLISRYVKFRRLITIIPRTLILLEITSVVELIRFVAQLTNNSLISLLNCTGASGCTRRDLKVIINKSLEAIIRTQEKRSFQIRIIYGITDNTGTSDVRTHCPGIYFTAPEFFVRNNCIVDNIGRFIENEKNLMPGRSAVFIAVPWYDWLYICNCI